MKKTPFALLFLFVLVLGIVLLVHHVRQTAVPPPGTDSETTSPGVSANTGSAPASNPTGTPTAIPAPGGSQPGTLPGTAATNTAVTPSASSTNLPSLPPQMVLDNMRMVIHNYCEVLGENPVGDNAEITAALAGKNPKQVNFLREDTGLRQNDKGELVDAWGTPFFFHQVSGKVMEIRSAGQDRKMWTFDDLVTR